MPYNFCQSSLKTFFIKKKVVLFEKLASNPDFFDIYSARAIDLVFDELIVSVLTEAPLDIHSGPAARAAGRLTVKVVPASSLVWTVMVPPSFCTSP